MMIPAHSDVLKEFDDADIETTARTLKMVYDNLQATPMRFQRTSIEN
jgi:hypothetical protein